MSHAIRFHRTGGPEVLQWEAVEPPPPGPGEVRLRHQAVGLNFIDTYHRSGLYPLPLPSGLGMEGAGVVEAVGEGVSEVKAGDRVAYTSGPLDAYSEVRNIPARNLVVLPADISFEQGAAMMLQGITAHYLLHSTYPVKAGETILVHAAAGGVGSILVQWAKLLGATVIGTVGNDDKAVRAKALGCDHVIVYSREKFSERVRELTGGRGVDRVVEVGGPGTIGQSLRAVALGGEIASIGFLSTENPGVDFFQLKASGASFRNITVGDRAALLDLNRAVGASGLKPVIDRVFAFEEAREAFAHLESGTHLGKVVIRCLN